MSLHDQNYTTSKICANSVLSSKFMLNINNFTNWYNLFYQLIKYILSIGKIKHEYSTNILLMLFICVYSHNLFFAIIVLVLKNIALIAKYAFHIFSCIKILGSENLRFSIYSLTKRIYLYVIECAPALSHDTLRLWRLVGRLAHDMQASRHIPTLITMNYLFYHGLTERSDCINMIDLTTG